MSQIGIAAFSAILGALVATVISLYSGLRREYGVRASRMLALKGDFRRAERIIDTALDKTQLWPEQYSLASSAWRAYGGDLVLHHQRSSWTKLEELSTALELTDCWADELRTKAAKAGGRAWPSPFEEQLKALKNDDLPAGLRILEIGLQGARSRYRLRWGIAGLALLAFGIGLVVLLTSLSSPALTSSSLEQAIENESPAITKTICDQRRPLEGAYVCAVDYLPCAGRLEASTAKGPSCGGQGRVVVGAVTDGDCWAETFLRPVPATNQPRQQTPETFVAWLKEKLQRSGCILG